MFVSLSSFAGCSPLRCLLLPLSCLEPVHPKLFFRLHPNFLFSLFSRHHLQRYLVFWRSDFPGFCGYPPHLHLFSYLLLGPFFSFVRYRFSDVSSFLKQECCFYRYDTAVESTSFWVLKSLSPPLFCLNTCSLNPHFVNYSSKVEGSCLFCPYLQKR